MSDITTDEPVNRDIAEVKAAKDLSFDEQVADLARFVQNEPLIREIDCKVLKYCFERKDLSDIESQMALYPEFGAAPRDQYTLIMELVNHYGLEFFELDEDGDPVLEADKRGLSENEIDDLVVGFAFQTTEVGKAVSDMLDPLQRLTQLMDIVPARRDTYIEILDFLRDKHSFAEVDSLLRGRDIMLEGSGVDGQPVQASVFVDKLERAGGVFFFSGWQTSEAGVEFLSSVQCPNSN